MKCNYCDKDKPERMFYKYQIENNKCIDCCNKCNHGKRKRRCIECNGSLLCEHKKQFIICKQCKGKKGNKICEHDRYIAQCKVCKGVGICIHDNYKKSCLQCNPIGNFIKRQRDTLYRQVKLKCQTSNDYIGCSNEFLYQHIKLQMKDNMNFENIHIDHIKPISKFDLTNEEEIKRCFHWSNLQPLLAEDNLSKSNKWSDKEEEHWKNNIIKI